MIAVRRHLWRIGAAIVGPLATGRAVRALRVVLAANALFNLVGAVILFVAPRAMMGLFGVDLAQSSLFLCYLLGAASLGFATLCALGAVRPYTGTLAAAVAPTVVFNATTAIVGIVILLGGFSPLVWVNIGVHAVLAIAVAAAGLAFARALRASDTISTRSKP
jgi:hypothetical protein